MPGLGATYQNNVLDAILGSGGITLGSGVTIPSNVWIALFTVAPTSAGGGTEVSTSGTAYVREEVANDPTTWPNAASGSKAIGIAVEFATATADWGTVVAFAVFDAVTGGTLIAFGNIGTPLDVATAITAKFDIGGLVATAA